jgi:hypothetical protein
MCSARKRSTQIAQGLRPGRFVIVEGNGTDRATGTHCNYYYPCWAGLLIMAASGVTMFLSYKDFLLYTPTFYVKMLFVGTLFINAFFIGKFLKVATERPFSALTKKEKFPLFLSGAFSTIGWVGAISCGLILSSLL